MGQHVHFLCTRDRVQPPLMVHQSDNDTCSSSLVLFSMGILRMGKKGNPCTPHHLNESVLAIIIDSGLMSAI